MEMAGITERSVRTLTGVEIGGRVKHEKQKIRGVSMPSSNVFEAQDEAYRGISIAFGGY